MNVLLVMIPLSLLLLAGAAAAFFWAVDHDQFDDMETPSLLPLDDAPNADALDKRPGQTRPARSASRFGI
jgi:cbb3-type cytochrome oxidase maturation protein